METQAEKVYVAIGTDPQEGFGTLEWALRKWSSHSISIVILHAANDTYKNYVWTPIGKLPTSSVSDEKLKLLRKMEEGKIDKLLSQYIAFCGKMKAEIHKIEKYVEPIHKIIVDLISGLRITKLVMDITFMKSSSWKSRTAINGLFYIGRHKPDFCELFIICGGKLVSLREENSEGFIEDDKGLVVAKIKDRVSFKGLLGKMFPETATCEKIPDSLPSSTTSSNESPDQWEIYAREIENYFHQLLSSNSDEEDGAVENIDILRTSPTAPDVAENMNAAEKIELLKTRIATAHELIQLKRKQAQANVERQARAEWAIRLCTSQAEELEARINEDIANRVELKKELDIAKEELHEVQSEVEGKKSRLNSILELQQELSNKLQLSSLAKSQAEAQLEKTVTKRAMMICEIEEMRRQRDVLQRRIEFCREKDAIGMATTLGVLCFNCKVFTAEEIRAATDDFSELLNLKSAGVRTNVYRGRINHTTIAIKLYDSTQEGFQAKVKHLSHIRHPHIVAMIGFCSELKCIVFEYLHNGCLRDTLFLGHRGLNRGLNWHARIRIAAEVCSGLGCLHSAQPWPIVHGHLNPSKILLDRNFVAKVHGFRLDWCYNESDVQSEDIRGFGNLVLQLLTGRNWAGLVEEAKVMDPEALATALDSMAGEWPLDLAVELAGIAMRCLSGNEGPATVMRELNEVKQKADDLVASLGCEEPTEGDVDTEDSSNVPSVFLCPIYQDVMKNPHIAADGFSYEQEAIEEWLRTGHNTSPMTNLKLKHNLLTPNHTLRSLIQDWQNKRSIHHA